MYAVSTDNKIGLKLLATRKYNFAACRILCHHQPDTIYS